MSQLGDLGKEATKALNRILPTTKVLIGAGAGSFAGYVTVKHGKPMALGVGSGLIMLQLAMTEGHITSDTCLIGTSFLGGLLLGMTMN